MKGARERYYKNIDKEKARGKIYREKNKEKIKKRVEEYNKRPEVKERRNKRQKAYRLRTDVNFRNKERDRTKNFFPLDGKQCEFCNNKAEEHHHYTKPYRFSKFWYVCRECHKKIHKEGKDAFLEGQRWK